MLLLPPIMGEKTELSACPGSHLSWPGPRFEPRFVIKGHAHLSMLLFMAHLVPLYHPF